MQRIQRDEGTQGTGPKHSIVQRRKRKIKKDNDDEQEVAELSSDLLEFISKRLDVVGFCAFGVVCKSWWEVYVRSREDFLESVAPMAVLISSHAKRSVNLYDMANGNTKKVMLRNQFVGKFFVGCSIGYMTIEDCRNGEISLINPLSGHELNFNSPSSALQGKPLHDLIIFIPTLSFRNHSILTVCNSTHEIQFFHSRHSRWFTGRFFGHPWTDIAFFKNQIYFVTMKARLGNLTITESGIDLNWLVVENTPDVNAQNMKLVASNNQLLMVDFVPNRHLNIHKIDFNSMGWVKQDKLGDQALFFGGNWGPSITKPGKWGGQSNCVYYLEASSSMCYIYSMEAKLIEKFSLVENPTTSKLYSEGWYYPHQCMKIDYHMDDRAM
ncbi:uncharacterized protein LOC109806624 isoform X2 [Cajanus cajan]|uniref:uncharacterized protein LOC109806624 isoform X2 n=1 Tax=Cajanus cajan TaxID=3821 RepID=UPI00098D9DD4|nr:uncharacterized protein LOC109806624 isoform X2 [Cajanus cajan]